MRKTRIPFAAALAIAALSTPSATSASTLGDVVSLSVIGAPFRAEIRLHGDIGAGSADCLRLGTAGQSTDGLPWLTQASVRVTDKPSPRLIVSGVQAVHEPTLKLAIEDFCANRLRREYTLLLPYPAAGSAVSASIQESEGAGSSQRLSALEDAPEKRPTPKPSTVRTAAPLADRLIVANEAAPKEVVSTAASSRTAADSISLRELAAAIDRSIIAEMEMMARIRDLEEARIRVETHIQALNSALENTASSVSGSAPPPDAASSAGPSAPIDMAPTATTDSDSDTNFSDRYLLLGLGLGVLLLALLLRRRTNQRSTPRSIKPPAPTSLMGSPAVDSASGNSSTENLGLAAAMSPAAVEGTVDWSLPDAKASTPKAIDSAGAEPAEEHQSAVELADIMMSFGRLHGAADTLSEFIRGNPKQAVTPWLKLLEVYRAAGLRAEFDAMAKEFNKTFNVITVTWDNYDDLRMNTVSVEHMPHIIAHIEQTWRTRDCQVYLQRLLRDNRAGTRAGFPFSVIDDILMLSAVLEEELGPALPPAGTGRVRTE